jgi:hypothetical protein
MKNLYPLTKTNFMALYYLSDSERELQELMTIGRKTKKQRQAKRATKKQTRQVKRKTKKATKQIKKTARKEKRVIKKAERKEKGGILKRVLRVPMAPARAAFLAAVSINALKLATKLVAGYKKNPDKVRKFWQKAGGDWSKLAQAISKGAKTQISGYTNDEMGAIAAGLVAAAPLIIAVTALFKELGLFSRGEEEQYKSVSDEGTRALYQDENIEETTAAMPEDSEGVAVMPKTDWLTKTQEGIELLDKLREGGSEDVSKAATFIEETEDIPTERATDTDESTDEDTKTNYTPLLIGGGIAAALFFFMKN